MPVLLLLGSQLEHRDMLHFLMKGEVEFQWPWPSPHECMQALTNVSMFSDVSQRPECNYAQFPGHIGGRVVALLVH